MACAAARFTITTRRRYMASLPSSVPKRAPAAWSRACAGAALLALLTVPAHAHGDAREALANASVRRPLARTMGELREAGREDESQRLERILTALGAGPEEIARESERGTEEARGEREWADALRDGARRLAATIPLPPQPPEARDYELATWVLAIDDQEERANTLLGRARVGGRWVGESATEREAGRARLIETARWALALPIETQRGPGETDDVSAYGVTLRGELPAARRERVLRAALRGACLSYALTSGRLERPPFATRTFHVVGSTLAFERALDEAVAAGGVPVEERAGLANHAAFYDARGWRTVHWRSEAFVQSVVLYDLAPSWLGAGAQPCLVAGHLNWVTLRAFGILLPHVSWREDTERTWANGASAGGPRSPWRLAQRGLYGLRDWMVQRAASEGAPGYHRAMLDEVGKIQDELLVKATLVAEYLMERERFRSVLAETRRAQRRVEAFERALGASLPEFEAHWRRWLSPQEGLVQTLERTLGATEDWEHALVAAIRTARRRAFAAGPPRPDAAEIVLDRALSRGAQAHADYLARHRDQLARWPDAHEEYAEREGFSPREPGPARTPSSTPARASRRRSTRGSRPSTTACRSWTRAWCASARGAATT